MIINSVNIESFGALKNIHIDFQEGTNLIFGENEAGKSTIENFVKIWLYGFSNYRGKNILANERLKYMPLTGERMKGILTVEVNKRQYMIIRSFGKVKKDDEIKIIDSISGQDLTKNYGENIGQELLGVNRSTFTKTLFIGQLDVEIKKDKDEKIIDNIVSYAANDDESISANKSLEKIDSYIKSISNVRKNGTLDLAREKRGILELEKIEYIKLQQDNIENKQKLIELNNKKEQCKDDIEIFKFYEKYIKFNNLRERYSCIIDKENQIKSFNNKKRKLEEEISFLQYKKNECIKNIESIYKVLEEKENIKDIFFQYENKLKELKNIYEELDKDNYRNKYIIMLIIFITNLLLLIFTPLKIILLIMEILLIVYYLYLRFFDKESDSYKINKVKKELKDIEKTLDNLKEKFKVDTYEEVFKKMNSYYNYSNLKEAIDLKIGKIRETINIINIKLDLQDENEYSNEKNYLKKKILEIKNSERKIFDEKYISTIKNKINNLEELNYLEKQDYLQEVLNNSALDLTKYEKEILALENRIDSSFYGKRTLGEIEEDIINTDINIEMLKNNLRAGEMARDIMRKAYLEIKDDFSPYISEKLLSIYNGINKKAYNNVLVYDECDMKLIKSNNIIDYKILSNGAKDQLFLALRLAFIDMIFYNKDISLFFDDSFVQYDDKNLKNTLELILNKGYRQIIIFTCQHREKNIIESLNGEINYIEINNNK